MPLITVLNLNLIEVLFVSIFKTDNKDNALGYCEGLLGECLFLYGLGVILIALLRTNDYVEMVELYLEELSLRKQIQGKSCFECKNPLKLPNIYKVHLFIEFIWMLLWDCQGKKENYFISRYRLDAKVRQCNHIVHEECFKKNPDKCAYCS